MYTTHLLLSSFQGHRRYRKQLAVWQAQLAAHQLPLGELEGRLLPPVRRHQDRLGVRRDADEAAIPEKKWRQDSNVSSVAFRLRDNTIKMWDRATLSCLRVLNGHTGSVLCLQYDDKVIISGSSDSTVREGSGIVPLSFQVQPKSWCYFFVASSP